MLDGDKMTELAGARINIPVYGFSESGRPLRARSASNDSTWYAREN
jgi:hypothetical protein